MSDPLERWLTIVGLGEDGAQGLTPVARAALMAAEVIMGPPRHLQLLSELLSEIKAQIVPWPVPFADGVPQVLGLRGRRVVVLASGDPFWFGAGAVLAARLAPGEWRALPAVSSLSLAASQLGWRLEQVTCLGLHAAPLTRLRPHLAPGRRIIATLRDAAAVGELAGYLCDSGHGATVLHVMEALGGPRARLRSLCAQAVSAQLPAASVQTPVLVALEPEGPALTLAAGRADAVFETDGVMTKRPVRALTLSALAPRPGEHLWDIGGGSGSVAIEWLLCDASLSAITVEPKAERAARIARNALALGVDRLQVVQGLAPEALEGLAPEAQQGLAPEAKPGLAPEAQQGLAPEAQQGLAPRAQPGLAPRAQQGLAPRARGGARRPDAVFVGGGLSVALLHWLEAHLPGVRLVANAVTLESEALLAQAHARLGGDLLRIELAQAAALGPRRGWKAGYPVVQWSVTL